MPFAGYIRVILLCLWEFVMRSIIHIFVVLIWSNAVAFSFAAYESDAGAGLVHLALFFAAGMVAMGQVVKLINEVKE